MKKGSLEQMLELSLEWVLGRHWEQQCSLLETGDLQQGSMWWALGDQDKISEGVWERGGQGEQMMLHLKWGLCSGLAPTRDFPSEDWQPCSVAEVAGLEVLVARTVILSCWDDPEIAPRFSILD